MTKVFMNSSLWEIVSADLAASPYILSGESDLLALFFEQLSSFILLSFTISKIQQEAL